jgi:hypothetical protein
MNSSRDQQIEALQATLRVARENENRWMEISPDFSADAERMEQWSSTAKLRRFEIERIEALLAGARELMAWSNQSAMGRLERKTEWERRLSLLIWNSGDVLSYPSSKSLRKGGAPGPPCR